MTRIAGTISCVLLAAVSGYGAWVLRAEDQTSWLLVVLALFMAFLPLSFLIPPKARRAPEAPRSDALRDPLPSSPSPF